MKKPTKIALEIIPTIIMLLMLIFIKSEIGLTILALLVITATFMIKYQKKEVYVFLFGAIIGIILELIGNFLLGQSWPQASFFTIPIWLPLTWGYGFVLIRRIGEIIVK